MAMWSSRTLKRSILTTTEKAAEEGSMSRKAKRGAAMRTLDQLAGPLTFGGSLEAIRLGEGISQAAFSERLGISRQHLCDIEKGRRLPSVERAARWGDELGYGQALMVQLVLQDELARAKLDLKVSISA